MPVTEMHSITVVVDEMVNVTEVVNVTTMVRIQLPAELSAQCWCCRRVTGQGGYEDMGCRRSAKIKPNTPCQYSGASGFSA